MDSSRMHANSNNNGNDFDSDSTTTKIFLSSVSIVDGYGVDCQLRPSRNWILNVIPFTLTFFIKSHTGVKPPKH